MPTDDEMLARVHAIKGTPMPRAAPSGGWLPPPPPKLSDADAAEELLAAATDAISLAGSRGTGGGATYNDAALAALAAGARPRRDAVGASSTDAPLVAPSRGELRGLGRDATAVLRDVHHQFPGVGIAKLPKDASAPGMLYGDDDDDDVDDDDEEEAARLLEQLQDELVFEERETASAKPPLPLPAPTTGGGGAGGTALFPSAPTNAPSRSRGGAAHAGSTSVTPAGVPAAKTVTEADDEQDRWCSICTEDAVVWCVECDNEPFCTRCWREGHAEEEDLRCHRTVKISGGRRRPR